jgi:hypothetical protein
VRGVLSPALAARIQPTVPDTAPRTSYEFERVWNELRRDAALLHRYLQLVDPATYTTLFKESMDSDLFGHILLTLAEVTTVYDAIGKKN